MDAAGADTSAGAGASDETQTQNNLDDVGTIDLGDLFVMFLSLAFVIGVIYVIYFLMKKGIGKKIAENDMIKILGSKIINGSKAVHIIGIGKSIYLIGSSNESINLISEVTDKESTDWIQLAAAEQSKKGPARFKDILSNLFKQQPKEKVIFDESADFIKKQRERLKNMKEE